MDPVSATILVFGALGKRVPELLTELSDIFIQKFSRIIYKPCIF